MPETKTIDTLEKNLKIIRKEVMWLVANVTPITIRLFDAIKNCEDAVSKLGRLK